MDESTEACVDFGSDSFLERRDAGSGSGGDEVSSFVTVKPGQAFPSLTN